MRVALFLLASLVSSRALADQWDPFTPSDPDGAFFPSPTTTPKSESPREEGPRLRWYGGETLGVDAASIGIALLGSKANSAELATCGLIGYVFGAPIVHGVHRHGEKALGSGLLRIGMPLGGGMIGFAARDGEGFFSGLEGFVIGAMVGVGAAITIDASVLAWEPAPPQRWRPTASVRPDGITLGATGEF